LDRRGAVAQPSGGGGRRAACRPLPESRLPSRRRRGAQGQGLVAPRPAGDDGVGAAEVLTMRVMIGGLLCAGCLLAAKPSAAARPPESIAIEGPAVGAPL